MIKNRGFMFLLLVMTLLVVACSNKEYEEAMEKGEGSVAEEEYEEAVTHFERALEEKEEDETAHTYLKQTETFINAEEEFENNIKKAKELFTKVKDEEEGLAELVDRAKEELEQIEELEATYEDVENMLAEANDKSGQGQFDEALNLIESMAKEDLSHDHFSVHVKDMDTLKSEVKALKKTKKEAAEALEKAKSFEKEKDYEEGIKVVDQVLKKDLEHDSLESLKKDLDAQKDTLTKAHEKQLAAEEARKKEAAMIQDIYGYWTTYGTDGGGIGIEVMQITESEFIWAVTESGVMTYAETSLTEADVKEKIVKGQSSEMGAFTIDVINEGEIIFGDATYKKVGKEEMREIIGGNRDVDEFFEFIKEAAQVEFP